MKKKLIEVSLPLEAINEEAAREKSIRHGHPSTLHLWWSRKPLAACRAVLFASLVDDPSSHKDKFPTEEAQQKERERLHGLIKRLVVWKNIGDEQLYRDAYEEILKSTNSNPPPILDPFAGGGSIPLEAQRLGLKAHAGDLNPVAVLINKAMIEIPPKFAGNPPVNPESRTRLGGSSSGYKGAAGLAADVQYYGAWMKEQAEKRVGHLYPKAKLPGGSEATVIAWKWARTVKCPNPACGVKMPLVNSFELSKKKNKEAWVLPKISSDRKSFEFVVQHGKGKVPGGTVNRKGARCVCCGQPVEFPYIREEAKAGRMDSRLMAIVADGDHGREYLSPDKLHIQTADVPKPNEYPDALLPHNPRDFKTPNYGMRTFSDLFTSRQLTTLVTLSDLIGDAIAKVKQDAISAKLPDDNIGLDDGGVGACAYAEAIGVYLAFCLDKETDYSSSICTWNVSRDGLRNTFSRQAIPMIWDFAETNIFSDQSGCWDNCVEWVAECISCFTPNAQGFATQQDATQLGNQVPIVISTDPPYYDNIGYADLSDFFYIWLRRSLDKIYPNLFSTMLVPKAEELVATPYRFNGDAEKARDFFEDGMYSAFSKMRETSSPEYPLTIYYAFKQSESDEDSTNVAGTKIVSTGWESMLSALIKAGFTVTGTWPMRTERPGRTISIESNALASSIALVCRPRPENAPSISRRKFLSELKERLKEGLHYLQTGNIAPVDLQQAAIGPGMEVYSKYSEVLEADGTPMNVHEALVLINQELDAYLNAQEGGMDSDSRFCIAWYELHGLNAGKSGEADTLARAKLAHLHELVADGVLEHARGVTRLKGRNELPEKWDVSRENTVWTMVQRLCRLLEQGGGIGAAAVAMRELSTPNYENLENIKSLAYRAYLAAERQHATAEAFAYNSLVSAWPELLERMDQLKQEVPEQTKLNI